MVLLEMTGKVESGQYIAFDECSSETWKPDTLLELIEKSSIGRAILCH